MNERINYLALNDRQLRTNGNIYRFMSYQLRPSASVLCSAECISGPDRGKLIRDFVHDRTETTKCLKVGIRHNLFVFFHANR